MGVNLIMENVLQYKDFIGTVSFSEADKIFFGKIEGINDLVTFEGETVDELINAFHEAVEDYLELCKQVNKEPMKSFKGSFNVRINPELHRKAYQKAVMKKKSLNQFVQEAIEHELEHID